MTTPFTDPCPPKTAPYHLRDFDAREYEQHVRLREAMERLQHERRQIPTEGRDG